MGDGYYDPNMSAYGMYGGMGMSGGMDDHHHHHHHHDHDGGGGMGFADVAYAQMQYQQQGMAMYQPQMQLQPQQTQMPMQYPTMYQNMQMQPQPQMPMQMQMQYQQQTMQPQMQYQAQAMQPQMQYAQAPMQVMQPQAAYQPLSTSMTTPQQQMIPQMPVQNQYATLPQAVMQNLPVMQPQTVVQPTGTAQTQMMSTMSMIAQYPPAVAVSDPNQQAIPPHHPGWDKLKEHVYQQDLASTMVSASQTPPLTTSSQSVLSTSSSVAVYPPASPTPPPVSSPPPKLRPRVPIDSVLYGGAFVLGAALDTLQIARMMTGTPVRATASSKKASRLTETKLTLSSDNKSISTTKTSVALAAVEELILGERATCSLTIVYSGANKQEFLNIVAANSADLELWTQGIFHLANSLKDADFSTSFILQERRKIEEATLSEKKLKSLLRKLNFTGSDAEISEKFKFVDTDKNLSLDDKKFISLINLLRHHKEIDDIFPVHSTGGRMSVSQLKSFIETEQKEALAEPECLSLIQLFENPTATELSVVGFENFLISKSNDVFDPQRALEYMDMNQTLTSYFLASSHNTYLEGNQLNSKSSREAYIKCLKTGCRCVEVDIWDGDDGEPVTFHGHTLTSKMKFREVMQTIAQYAFIRSPYPLILSFENHCTLPQQKLMADHIKAILGNMVAAPLHNQPNCDSITELPSPNTLQGKILIKGSVMDENNQGKIHKSLSDLTYLKAGTKMELVKAKDMMKPWEMMSFSEGGIKKQQHQHLVMYNMRHFTRTYPKGSRVDSSNYDPVGCWHASCQMVALNYQTPDEPMWIQHGKFRENGRCGYLLKPAYMRGGPAVSAGRTSVRITVFSARNLPKLKNSVVSPTIQISMCDSNTTETHLKTRPIVNNGFNPQWNEQKFFYIRSSDTAMIVFLVESEERMGSKKLAQAAIPVPCAREGFRIVPLNDPHGRPLPMCYLFCKFEFNVAF
ncbi:1-phosphatidylinositol 4,5-bisphosphate phosphodiesterase eta-2 [Pelomyxa schiedti]|nr:1-phosphatidylinositol 4,5-bisphosphate phosphodiesterase eta-2 [Pelomyxa schiedti]